MKDITKQLGRYTIDEQEVSEAKFSVANTLRAFKDILNVLQAIHDLKSARVDSAEKREMMEEYVESLNYIMRKKPLSGYAQEMVVAGLLISMKHAGFKMDDFDVDFD